MSIEVPATQRVVLIHGGTGTARDWAGVGDLLGPGVATLAVTMPGHEGGEPLAGPATIDDYVDGVQAQMDAAGFARAHIVGVSVGGWVAMELARRGRALSVVALSPSGGWTQPDARIRRLFVSMNQQLRTSRPLLPLTMRVPFARRFAFRTVAEHGDRLSYEQAMDALNGALRCDLQNMLPLADTGVRAYPDPAVPVLIAWAEKDRVFPQPRYSDPWRAAAPFATWQTLEGVGHIPMYDDPALVAATIADWIAPTS